VNFIDALEAVWFNRYVFGARDHRPINPSKPVVKSFHRLKRTSLRGELTEAPVEESGSTQRA